MTLGPSCLLLSLPLAISAWRRAGWALTPLLTCESTTSVYSEYVFLPLQSLGRSELRHQNRGGLCGRDRAVICCVHLPLPQGRDLRAHCSSHDATLLPGPASAGSSCLGTEDLCWDPGSVAMLAVPDARLRARDIHPSSCWIVTLLFLVASALRDLGPDPPAVGRAQKREEWKRRKQRQGSAG